jgi:hypothetical protein
MHAPGVGRAMSRRYRPDPRRPDRGIERFITSGDGLPRRRRVPGRAPDRGAVLRFLRCWLGKGAADQEARVLVTRA